MVFRQRTLSPEAWHRVCPLIPHVFNLLGTDNLLASQGAGSWVTNALSDSFGRILTALPRQQAELAARTSGKRANRGGEP